MYSRLLRIHEVKERTGLSRSTIYDLIKKNQFPKGIAITKRCVGWVEDDIHDWIVGRLEAAGRLG